MKTDVTMTQLHHDILAFLTTGKRTTIVIHNHFRTATTGSVLLMLRDMKRMGYIKLHMTPKRTSYELTEAGKHIVSMRDTLPCTEGEAMASTDTERAVAPGVVCKCHEPGSFCPMHGENTNTPSHPSIQHKGPPIDDPNRIY